MNYHRALCRLGHGDAIDIDVQLSAEGTMWALHWPTVGKNRLRDPRGLIGPDARIEHLRDAEIMRLRASGRRGRTADSRPWKVWRLLLTAAGRRVRVELELKTFVPQRTLEALLVNRKIYGAHHDGLIQVKTLVKIPGAVKRLQAAHDAGFTTILCFSFWRGHAVDKDRAWPVTDYVRGRRVVWR